MSGVRFRVNLTNVRAIDGYIGTNFSTVNVTTGANGDINLTGIVPQSYDDDIVLEFTEVEAPAGYLPLENPVTVTIKYENGAYTVTGNGATISGNQVTVNVENTPNMRICGYVWEDTQIGVKNIKGPDGLQHESEVVIPGVRVALVKASDNSIIETTSTSANGFYEFRNIAQIEDGYKIAFFYNGIKYQEVKSYGLPGAGSTATEIGREAFNNKFKIISKDKSNADIPLGYDYDETSKTSTLQAPAGGWNPANNDEDDFMIRAETGIFTRPAINVSLGLVRKELDLSITATAAKNARQDETDTYVTYGVILKNHVTNNATVDEFVYYYDDVYTPNNITGTDKYDVSIDETNRKITFTSKNNGFKLVAPDYRTTINIEFKVNKDLGGNLVEKENIRNIAEITKYSSDVGGLIDRDSAPGNANVTITNGTPVAGRLEDDTSVVKGIIPTF